MKKQFIGGLILGLSVGSVIAFAAQYAAVENPFPVKYNGNDVEIEGYNINDSTYFKLRDVADIVGGFSVDFQNGTILLSSSKVNAVTNTENTFSVGDVWTVDGQWSFKIDSVVETAERNQFSDKNPAAVYEVTYSYTNIGYEDSDGIMDGLYISLDDFVDAKNQMAYTYPNTTSTYAKETPIGATCTAKEFVGVENPGDFKIYLSKYDGNGTKHKAVFDVKVEK